jgi:hypothetical protein
MIDGLAALWGARVCAIFASSVPWLEEGNRDSGRDENHGFKQGGNAGTATPVDAVDAVQPLCCRRLALARD